MKLLIGFGAALAHCFGTGSYTFFLLVAALLLVGSVFFAIKNKTLEQAAKYGIVALFVVVFLVSLLLRPAEVAANTTQEQADRGVYLGY